ncbi:MAG: hypothetical protein V2A56_04875 [bacterium]
MFIYHEMIKRSTGHIRLARIVSYFQMLMRLNALLIGSVAVQMVLSGIREFTALG